MRLPMRIGHQAANNDKSFSAVKDDVMFENCGCEYVVIDGGRPWMMGKTITCPNCSAREVINAANAAKQKRVQEIDTRLAEIDKVEGPRVVREERLADGKIGIVNDSYPQGRLVMLEAEASVLRAELKGL